jgi:hypothetical protein
MSVQRDGTLRSSRRGSPRSAVLPEAQFASPREHAHWQVHAASPRPAVSEVRDEAEEEEEATWERQRRRHHQKLQRQQLEEDESGKEREQETKYEEQKQQGGYLFNTSQEEAHSARSSRSRAPPVLEKAHGAGSSRGRTPRVLEDEDSQPPRSSGRGRTPRSLEQGAPAVTSSRGRTPRVREEEPYAGPRSTATPREQGEGKTARGRSPREAEARSSRSRSSRSPAAPDTRLASPRGRGRSPLEPASPGFAARLPPTSDEHINAYAVYLGMDPERDREWLWLAEECLYAPLPAGWSEARAPNGDTYFWREPNGKAQWEHPLDDFFRQLFKRLRGEARERAARERGLRRQHSGRRPRSAAPLGRSREEEADREAPRALTPRPSSTRSSALTQARPRSASALTNLLRSNKVEPGGDGPGEPAPASDALASSRSTPAPGRAAEPPRRVKGGRVAPTGERLGQSSMLTVEIPELDSADDSDDSGRGRGRELQGRRRGRRHEQQQGSPAMSPSSPGGRQSAAPFLLVRPFCEWRERPLWWREPGSRHRSSELEVRGRTLAPEHLTALADYFGLQLPQDGHLMWIVKLAALCPLPLDWRVCPEEFASDLFFANVRTSATSRHHPMDPFWALLLQAERECPLTAAEQGALAQQAWLRFRDDDGDAFWYDFARLASEYDPRGPGASAPLQPPWLVARCCTPGGGGHELGGYRAALWCALAAVHGDAATGRTAIFPLLVGGEAEPFLARHELFKAALLVDWLSEPLAQRVRDARAELDQRRGLVNDLRKTSVHLTKHAAAAKHAMPPPARRSRWPL